MARQLYGRKSWKKSPKYGRFSRNYYTMWLASRRSLSVSRGNIKLKNTIKSIEINLENEKRLLCPHSAHVPFDRPIRATNRPNVVRWQSMIRGGQKCPFVSETQSKIKKMIFRQQVGSRLPFYRDSLVWWWSYLHLLARRQFALELVRLCLKCFFEGIQNSIAFKDIKCQAITCRSSTSIQIEPLRFVSPWITALHCPKKPFFFCRRFSCFSRQSLLFAD